MYTLFCTELVVGVCKRSIADYPAVGLCKRSIAGPNKYIFAFVVGLCKRSIAGSRNNILIIMAQVAQGTAISHVAFIKVVEKGAVIACFG